jgi:hypothetical protein
MSLFTLYTQRRTQDHTINVLAKRAKDEAEKRLGELRAARQKKEQEEITKKKAVHAIHILFLICLLVTYVLIRRHKISW